MTNFFISYNKADRQWAEWIAWTLEEEGYTTKLQAWDFHSGCNFPIMMHNAADESERTILILSPDFLGSRFTAPEWAAAFVQDPTGEKGKLLPVKVRDCRPKGLLASISRIDLVGLDEEEAKRALITGVSLKRAKPESKPIYPIQSLIIEHSVPEQPQFPRVQPDKGITSPKGRLINVPPLPYNFIPRTQYLKEVKRTLLSLDEGSMAIDGTFRSVGLQGMGGIGKSILASALARDDDVRSHFFDGIFWLTMGVDPKTALKQSEMEYIALKQSELAYMLDGEPHLFKDSIEGNIYLSNMLTDKTCLIILDDVWRAGDVQALLGDLGLKSRVLITTRDASIITAIEAREYTLGLLSEEESRTLLAKWANVNVADLPSSVNEIIRECGRLPLALALCGAQVRDGISWDDLVDALKNADLKFLDHQHRSVMKSMRVSIDRLNADEASCYTELVVFPPDIAIPEAAIINLWAYSHKLTQREGRKLLVMLYRKSLMQRKSEKGIVEVKLHDLQHDFLKSTCIDIQAIHKMLLEAYWLKTGGNWSNGPNDGYFFQHLAYHLIQSDKRDEFKSLYLNDCWINAKLNNAGIASLVSELNLLSEQEKKSLGISIKFVSVDIPSLDNDILVIISLGDKLIRGSYDSSNEDISIMVNEYIKKYKKEDYHKHLEDVLKYFNELIEI